MTYGRWCFIFFSLIISVAVIYSKLFSAISPGVIVITLFLSILILYLFKNKIGILITVSIYCFFISAWRIQEKSDGLQSDHFIHAIDVASAVLLCVFNLRRSRNKIYIVADDNNQFQLHKVYAKSYNLKLLIIPISFRFLKLISKYFFLPKKILNLFFTISSEINYDNNKIKKELNFKTRYSLINKII